MNEFCEIKAHFTEFFQSDGDADEPMENPEQVRAECLEKFASKDYIMEPGIFNQLKKRVLSFYAELKKDASERDASEGFCIKTDFKMKFYMILLIFF